MKIRVLLLITTVTLTGLVTFPQSMRKFFPETVDTRRLPAPTQKGENPSVFQPRLPLDAGHPEPPVSTFQPVDTTAAETFAKEASGISGNETVHDDTAPSRWQQWQTALFSGDVRQIPIQGGLLAERLRQAPDPAIYQEMAMLLNDPGLPLASKNLLIGLLGEIATVEAMTELMLVAQQGNEFPLYLASLQAISQMAANRWGGRFHDELSPSLELAWQDMQGQDSAYAATLAKAIASVGTPGGVGILLDALTDPSRQVNVDETLRLKQKSAFAAIPEIRNPAAIETLSQHVSGDSLGAPGFEVSGLALATMGVPEATEQLLNWSETAPAAAASRIEDWFSKVQDSASVDMLLARQSTLNFQSAEVESAFDQALNYLNPPLDDLTTPIPTDSQGNGYDSAIVPFHLPIDMGLNDEGFAVNSGMDNDGFNPLDQVLRSDTIQAHPRKKRRDKLLKPRS